jgi:hypothetical protein
MGDWISATFYDPDQANTTFDELLALGYPRESISVEMSPETRTRHFGDADADIGLGRKTARAAAGGAAIGGALTAAAGAIATFATGGAAAPLIAAPIAVTLLAGGAGAAAGGIVGTIVGAGIPSEEAERIEHDGTEDAGVPTEEAQRIEHDVTEGAIVLSVRAQPDDAAQVRAILSGKN